MGKSIQIIKLVRFIMISYHKHIIDKEKLDKTK